MTETSDPQLQLKKRARRRLVGAVAFAGLAAVVLPMVMDEEPKQPVQDVQLRIPGQEQAPPFKPAEPPARSVAATPAVAKPVDESAAEKPPAATGGPSPSSSSLPAAAATAAAAGTVIAGKAVADKMAEKKTAPPPLKPADKKVAEKKADKPSNKAAGKLSTAQTSKTQDRPVSKPAAKKTDKSADSSSEGASGRTETDDAQRANALLSGKSSAPAKGGGGRHVIMVGAFANAENARQLQAKLGSAGVSAYTEVLDSPDGKKTRVRAGPFASREAAEKALEQMKRVGVSGVVSSRQ